MSHVIDRTHEDEDPIEDLIRVIRERLKRELRYDPKMTGSVSFSLAYYAGEHVLTSVSVVNKKKPRRRTTR